MCCNVTYSSSSSQNAFCHAYSESTASTDSTRGSGTAPIPPRIGDKVQTWILKAGSGWRQAETTDQNPQNMKRYAAGSEVALGVVTTHCVKWQVGTLGPVGGGANAQVAEDGPVSAFEITKTNEGITTKQFT